MKRIFFLITFVALASSNTLNRRQSRQASCGNKDGINMCNYENHNQLIQKLDNLQANYPNLASVGQVGSSIEGRPIKFIKISANVRQQRDLLKPMFKYVGNMHGDETVGRQMLIYLAHYLVQEYDRNPRVRRLLDTTEIYIMPTMNPDGYAVSSPGCSKGLGFFSSFLGFKPSGRENKNGVDLNRDFPKQFDENNNVNFARLSSGRQPETV